MLGSFVVGCAPPTVPSVATFDNAPAYFPRASVLRGFFHSCVTPASSRPPQLILPRPPPGAALDGESSPPEVTALVAEPEVAGESSPAEFDRRLGFMLSRDQTTAAPDPPPRPSLQLENGDQLAALPSSLARR